MIRKVSKSSAPNAREALLDTAERLFADRGAKAVSLREINAEAGCSEAALHHYFKNREGLMKALLARCQPAMFERRAEMLARLSLIKRPTLHQLVEALVRPLAVPLLKDPESGTLTVRLLARLHFERDPALIAAIQEGDALFLPQLKKLLPEMPERILKQRWVLTALVAHQALANISNQNLFATGGKQTLPSIEAYLEALIDYMVGGITRTIDSPG